MSVQLNLLPDIKKTYLKAQRTKNIIMSSSIIVTIVAGGLVAVAAGYVYFLQPQLISTSDSNITKKVTTLKAVDSIDSYLTVQNQLTVLTKLHDDKPTYSRLFDFLKVINPAPPNSVQLSSLQLNHSTTEINITGTTASYESFAIFRDTLTNAKLVYVKDQETVKESLFTNIAVESQSVAKDGAGQSKMNFNIILTYNENAFNFALDKVSVEVPNMETTQSVINAPGYDPSKLFDANARQQEEQK